MNLTSWIEYRGQRVLFFDFANRSAEEVKKACKYADEKLLPTYREVVPKSVLSLSDVTNAQVSKESIMALKASTKLWFPMYKKQAVIGVSGFHKIFLNAVNRFVGSRITSFSTREEALEWLVDGN